MVGRPKGKFTKTLGVDVPHPFAKKVESKKKVNQSLKEY